MRLLRSQEIKSHFLQHMSLSVKVRQGATGIHEQSKPKVLWEGFLNLTDRRFSKFALWVFEKQQSAEKQKQKRQELRK